MKRSLLLVEDDVLMRELIMDYFRKEQWEVFEADNGRMALELFDQTSVDLVVLDIMMPEMDGWSVCRRIRQKSACTSHYYYSESGRRGPGDGLRAGGREYVTKPFSPRVLVARANALIKRTEGTVGQDGDRIVFGNLTVYKSAHAVTVAGQAVNLSPKEYELLLFLIKHYGKVLSRDFILNGVWGYDYFGDERVVDTHIKKLRSKLGEEGSYIRTIIRSGYKFELDA